MTDEITKWNCPHCDEPFDREKQEYEEYTVGRIDPQSIPHMHCPKCKKCMGCEE